MATMLLFLMIKTLIVKQTEHGMQRPNKSKNNQNKKETKLKDDLE
jgi:hypothetical protein